MKGKIEVHITCFNKKTGRLRKDFYQTYCDTVQEAIDNEKEDDSFDDYIWTFKEVPIGTEEKHKKGLLKYLDHLCENNKTNPKAAFLGILQRSNI